MEAVALFLKLAGESDCACNQLINAIKLNNAAMQYNVKVGPDALTLRAGVETNGSPAASLDQGSGREHTPVVADATRVPCGR